MFKSKTLFILGAGASHEVGLPLGEELKSIIARKLNIRYDHGHLKSGDGEIARALAHKARTSGADLTNDYHHAAISISNAMQLANSIDSFIENNQGNDTIAFCGKVAIVQAILELERKSKIYYGDDRANGMNFSRIADTWLPAFFRLLHTGVHVNDVSEIFSNVSIITFNYDRSIEHFLYNALRHYFGFSAATAADIMQRLKIIHPYGKVGNLDWQETKPSIAYGGDVNSHDLINLATGIKTYSERVEDQETTERMHEMIVEAKTAVFLGFACHQQNMDILHPAKGGAVERIYATAYAESESNRHEIQGKIIDLFRPKGLMDLGIGNLTCNKLLDEYSRSITK